MDSDNKTPRKTNPRETINPVFALFFFHLFPIFSKSFKKGFKEEDIYAPLKEHTSSTLGDRLESIWLKEIRSSSKIALHKSLLKLFGLELAIIGIIKVAGEMLYLIVMTFSIGRLLEYFGGADAVTKKDAYMYAGLIVCTLAICNITAHSCFMAMMHMGMKARVACCSLIYRKSLRLSQSSLAKTTIGHMLNLLSNDVSKFDAAILLHYVWTSPFQALLGTYLLYRQIGPSAFGGMAFLLMFIPLQIYLAKKNSQIRLRTAVRTDKRVHLMEEVLSGIQAIKMYTWEKPFAKLVSATRRFEIKAIRNRYYLQSIVYSLDMFITRSCIFISIVGFTASGKTISASTAYTVATIYSVLRSLITMHFLYSILSFGEILITIKRLQRFLVLEELSFSIREKTISSEQDDDESHLLTKENMKLNEKNHCRITLKSVNAKWDSESTNNTLSNINLTIKESQLVAIIGSVGSGKSSLINVILKEMPISDGYLEIEGTVSYASQKSWLFSSTVRQNILFGTPYEESRYRTVIKVCSLEADLKMLPNGDQTVVGEKGNALSGGQKARINLARCVYKQADIYILDDPLSAVDIKVAKALFDNCITNFLRGKICILVTHQLQYLKDADKIIVLKDGIVVGDGNCNEIQNTGSDFAKLLEEFNKSDEDDSDNNVGILKRNSELFLNNGNEVQKIDNKNKEILQSGTIKTATYRSYVRAGGNWFLIVLLVLVFIAAQGLGNGGDYVVSRWINLEQQANQHNESVTGQVNGSNTTYDRNGIVYLYSGLTLGTIIFSFAHSLFFFMFFMNASINMHDMIFTKISSATMRFFNSNPVGRILNRFSKDMGIIDEYLPFVLIDFFHVVLLFLGTLTVTSIVNPWLLIPVAVLMVVSYLLRSVYIVTSRTVKRLEGITRSSIFNHITATMDGLSTVRAFNAQNVLTREFDSCQDLHSGAWYLFISSTRGFGLWIDITYISFLSFIIFSLLMFTKDHYQGGDVGLIITQYLNLVGIVQWGIRQWTELENNMTSVERVLEYTKVETEPVRHSAVDIPKSWPAFGEISIKGVSLRYDPNDAPVLKDLNFTISSGEKIGIVGRTGAGKSSSIIALFQLYEIEGTIIIDGIDTTTIPLDILRSKISIIPQAPVLFSGTVRNNLDPFEEFDDEVLWSALEDVKLKSVVTENSLGLSSPVLEGGSNFSIGQRQLICLARAIIRNNKILVMDEATANVDLYTDGLIQKTIRTKFAACTVLTIAHRIETVMDADRILVMDAGRMIEFDHPHNLLQQTSGLFYSMVQATGKISAQNLQTVAKENYMKKQ